MGFYVTESIKAKCPLYERVVRSDPAGIAGIQCANIVPDTDVSIMFRFKDLQEALKAKRHFCDSKDGYKHCLYYDAYTKISSSRFRHIPPQITSTRRKPMRTV